MRISRAPRRRRQAAHLHTWRDERRGGHAAAAPAAAAPLAASPAPQSQGPGCACAPANSSSTEFDTFIRNGSLTPSAEPKGARSGGYGRRASSCCHFCTHNASAHLWPAAGTWHSTLMSCCCCLCCLERCQRCTAVSWVHVACTHHHTRAPAGTARANLSAPAAGPSWQACTAPHAASKQDALPVFQPSPRQSASHMLHAPPCRLPAAWPTFPRLTRPLSNALPQLTGSETAPQWCAAAAHAPPAPASLPHAPWLLCGCQAAAVCCWAAVWLLGCL